MRGNFHITRLEKSRVIKRVEYEIIAADKAGALRNLNKMKYVSRDTIDEVEEDEWEPRQILSVEVS